MKVGIIELEEMSVDRQRFGKHVLAITIEKLLDMLYMRYVSYQILKSGHGPQRAARHQDMLAD
jgi:hypothetical protein